MGLNLKKSRDRGFSDEAWLKSYHTFSFGNYYNPRSMGFRSLRVINEDSVQPQKGFDPHAHRDMEILTIVLSGELAHKDNIDMENEKVIHSGEIQLMTAGQGIVHSEYNPSSTHDVHFLQIWILPDAKNLPPSYQQKKLNSHKNEWVLLVSREGLHGSLSIHQHVEIYLADLEPNHKLEYRLKENRFGWLQVIQGDLSVNELSVGRGDGVAIDPKTTLSILAKAPSKILFFDLN